MRQPAEMTGISRVELLILTVLGFLLLTVFSSRHTLDPRMPCGTDLSGIGKAILIYSNDYQDELPRAGGGGSV